MSLYRGRIFVENLTVQRLTLYGEYHYTEVDFV